MFNVYKQEVCCRAWFHCQLASMLALLLLLPHVAGKETPKDVPTIENITTCPDIGYYFKRDVTPNAIDPGPCKLCFCQDNSTAVCWLRDSIRCDPKRYSFIGRKKRQNRNRRSPGFSDIFFRDAARDVFDRQSPEQCKPFESSFSEGCPPVDWCIGCTVCDCDSNGRWDCHTLSFCPDEKGKKQVKKKRNPKKTIVKRQSRKIQKPTKTTTKKPNKNPVRKSNKKPIIGKKPQIKQNKSKQNKHKVNKKGNTKKISPVKKSKMPYQKKKIAPKIKGSNKKIEKGKKPITIKSNKDQRKKAQPLGDEETIRLTKIILNKVMASVNKVVSESQKKFNQAKILQKREMTKNFNIKHKKRKSKGVKNVKKWTPLNFPPNRKQRWSRRKRQITKDSVDDFEKEKKFGSPNIDDIVFSPSKNYNNTSLANEGSVLNTPNKIKYFVYNVDSKYNKNIKDIRNTTKNQFTKSQMLLKSNDLETINAFNVTRTDNKVFESDQNGTRTTPIAKLNNVHLKKSSLQENSLNNTSFKKNKSCGQICQLKKSLKKLIGGISTKNTQKKIFKPKNKNLMSYFRNFFRRFFQPNKKKNASIIKKQIYRKRNIIKSLCKNITSCKYDLMDKTLQYKLDQLHIESNNILKSVRIIKGLLKLFGDKENSIIANTSSIENNQENKDIFILNAILKDRYNLASIFTNLTETRLKQIDFIRDNTKNFIQSIEKFALILNDIMKLLRNNNKQRLSHRTLRCTKKHQNENIKNATVGEKIKKLKNLLINYNLVQNRFMKGMFDVLVTLDQKTKPDNNKLLKVSDENAKYNESLVIDSYTKNIIKNLRKLKNLAEKLNFNNRMKRAAMGEDDAIDYFLMLIEYLLKKNRPLDVPPVSDGIDILIEAIKNAPDIKPIENKVLDTIPLKAIKANIITTKSPLMPLYNSKNNKSDTKINLKANNNIKLFESLDEDSEGTNIYEFTDKYYPKPDSEKANKFSDDKSTINDLDLATSIPNVYIAKENDEKSSVILNTFDNDKNDDKRGYEVFVDDADEDEGFVSTSTRPPEIEMEIDIPVTQNIPKRTLPPNINGNNLKSSLNTINAFKKTRLDWIEENVSREEDKRDLLTIKETTTQTAAQTATRTQKTAPRKHSYPVSSMSRETEDERQDKTMSPEYVMYKKQMNLLNSLDYGTEKSLLDSESKEDKYISDSFPFM